MTTVLTPASQPKSLALYGISNPASPKLTATVGTNAFDNVGNLFLESGNLANPAQPHFGEVRTGALQPLLQV